MFAFNTSFKEFAIPYTHTCPRPESGRESGNYPILSKLLEHVGLAGPLYVHEEGRGLLDFDARIA